MSAPRLLASLVALVAACGSRAAAPRDAAPPTAPAAAALPTEPAAALPILDELNRWCAGQGDECDVAERGRDAYPDRVASGETNGWILDHRERLAALGVPVVWDAGRRRFLTQIEWDLRLMIDGMFAPDHLGPELHAAITRRAHAGAALYLGVLVDRVVGPAPDASWLSSSHVAATIALLRADDAAAATAAARRLLPLHEAALRASTPPPAADEHRAARLEDRIATLRAIAP